MSNTQRIYQMDGQLNHMRRVWFVEQTLDNNQQTAAVYRCWFRLQEIADKFETK